MVKLFRKIRTSNINRTQYGNYALYAIGEILLVVVGILLALQINNWNETRKKRIEEVKTLQKVRKDLENDILQLETHIYNTKDKMVLIDSLFTLLYNPREASLERLMYYNLQIPFVDYFIENRGTFDEGVASGKVSNIRTDSLREHIFEYYRFVQQSRTDAIQVKFTEDVVLPQWGEIVIPSQEGLGYLGFKTRLPPLDIAELARNKKYTQLIAQKYGTNQIQIDNWNRIILKANTLKRTVEQELNRIK